MRVPCDVVPSMYDAASTCSMGTAACVPFLGQIWAGGPAAACSGKHHGALYQEERADGYIIVLKLFESTFMSLPQDKGKSQA